MTLNDSREESLNEWFDFSEVPLGEMTSLFTGNIQPRLLFDLCMPWASAVGAAVVGIQHVLTLKVSSICYRRTKKEWFQ